ncbi:hypothetical protein AB0B30_36705 [Streptomyces narbonensis]|uniref:Uncharacterized protein n=1 Tax=Streptomyces narbonensis TaxID=67333 RepID=A0ABV3CL42_9ACTN
MLIYAFRDAHGAWHGDPDAAVRGAEPGRGVLTLPSTVAGQDPGVFDGQRIEVLYAACDAEPSQARYRLDDGETLLATWRVHELLSPAYQHVPTAPGAARDAPTTVKLEVGGPHRRYELRADLVAEGRVEIAVVVCTPDGEIRGELAGRMDAGDLGEVTRLLTDLARTASFDLAPRPRDLVPAPRPAAEPEEPKAYTVEEKRRQYPNAYKPWAPEDERRLAERCARGVSLRELSQEFGRNEGAVASRLLKIDAEGPAVEEAWEYGG